MTDLRPCLSFAPAPAIEFEASSEARLQRSQVLTPPGPGVSQGGQMASETQPLWGPSCTVGSRHCLTAHSQHHPTTTKAVGLSGTCPGELSLSRGMGTGTDSDISEGGGLGQDGPPWVHAQVPGLGVSHSCEGSSSGRSSGLTCQNSGTSGKPETRIRTTGGFFCFVLF